MRRAALAIAMLVGCGSSDPPTPPPPVTPTPIAALLAKKPMPNTRVAVEVVMLPEAVYETTDKIHRRYVPGVPADSPYLAKLADLAARAEALLPRARALVAHVTEKEYLAVSEAITALVREYNHARSSIADVAVIEIDTKTRIDAALETVYPSWLGPVDVPAIPRSVSIDEANAALTKLEAEDPPDLASEMPELGMLGASYSPLASEAQLRPYNRLVDRYNKELGRRRPYLARQTLLDLARLAAELKLLAQRPVERIDAVTTAVPDLADKVVDSDAIPAGHRLYLVERPTAKRWSLDYFSRGSLLVLSDPPGAQVTLDGVAAGTTPYLAADLAVGREVSIGLALDGRAPVSRTAKITAVPSRLVAITVLLEPVR